MKRYTVTANPDIQLATISLLRNLIKLRVNYSLLDHDGVFLRVLRSQIECAEKLIWRISDCEQILPSIFSFLVSISDDTKGRAQRILVRMVHTVWTNRKITFRTQKRYHQTK